MAALLYKCKECNAQGVFKSKRKTENIDHDVLERTYLECNSYRSSARIFEISHVSIFLKKKQKKILVY